jgi:hypothetical protein
LTDVTQSIPIIEYFAFLYPVSYFVTGIIGIGVKKFIGHKCSVKKDILFEARHTEPRNKTDKQSCLACKFISFSGMLHILANSYTALTFLVTFFVKKKSNKLLMGG